VDLPKAASVHFPLKEKEMSFMAVQHLAQTDPGVELSLILWM